jgi:poly(hydroxyalkanoate) depolymerase family esterase
VTKLEPPKEKDMNMDFANTMRTAMRLTRSSKLMAATRLIQETLSGKAPAQSEPGGEALPERPAIAPPILDLSVDAIEPELAPAQPGPVADLLAKFRQRELPSFNLDGLVGRTSRKPIDIPDGAEFRTCSFTCAAGTRAYKLYLPHRAQTGKRGLIVMLHGGTQDADDFAAGTRMNAFAEEHGFVVAYPIQPRAANAQLCWNWFTPENQARGHGEPSIIAGITREIIAEHDIDPARVFVAGLSAGGAMAAVMGATYPDLYAGIGVHSGLAYKSAADLPSAFAAMRGDRGPLVKRSRKKRGGTDDAPRLRTIVFHGDADNIVHASNAATIAGPVKNGESMQRADPSRSAARAHSLSVIRDESGRAVVEEWLIHGSGHAWSGGSPDGTYTDPSGPDASREMIRFFFAAS